MTTTSHEEIALTGLTHEPGGGGEEGGEGVRGGEREGGEGTPPVTATASATPVHVCDRDHAIPADAPLRSAGVNEAAMMMVISLIILFTLVA